MNCPSCQRTLPAGAQTCPACRAALGPPSEGALAPDLKREALRDLPGRRRREPEPPNWRDEVRRRMDKRRRQDRSATPSERVQPELPLFARLPAEPLPSAPSALPAPPAAPDSSGPWQLGTDESSESELFLEAHGEAGRDGSASLLDGDESQRPVDSRAAQLPVDSGGRRGHAASFEGARGVEFDSADLPLNAIDSGVERATERRLALEPPSVQDEWPLEEGEPSLEARQRPLDRPAHAVERLQAGLVDLGVLAALGATVIYFAGRTAQVSLAGLQPAWPWLAFYLGLLASLYAAYFTGTTGQTLGKMLFSLRVVDGDGQAPGFARALVRAGLGTLGLMALGLGAVPMLFDPAGRGLHDRLLRTRVVRSAA